MASIFNSKFPIKIIPQPDELLSSWLCRVAQAHSVKLNTLNAVVFPQNRIWNRDIDKCATDDFIKLLEAKTGVGLLALHRTRLQDFEGKLFENHNPNGNSAWIMPIGVFHSVRNRYGLQSCPHCLNEDITSYYRKVWRLSFVTVCVKHFCLLIDECPNCQKPIMFHRNELGIRQKHRIQSLTICSFCGIDWKSPAIQKKTVPVSEKEVDFQNKLIESVTSGWFELSQANPVHSIPFFKGLAQILKLLSVSRFGLSLRASLSNLRLENATFIEDIEQTEQTEGIKEVEQTKDTEKTFSFDLQRIKSRHAVLCSANYLLEGWADNFVELCRQNKIWSSALLHSMPEVPFWYGSVIAENLTRQNRVYSEQEIISILNFLETKDEVITLQSIKSLMSSEDIFDFFSFQFSISIFKRMIRHNQKVWNQTRTQRAKLKSQNIEWKKLIKLQKEIRQLQKTLETMISDYEVKERLEWVNNYLKIKNARKTGEVFGISEHTVRKWWRKYKRLGIEGLKTIFSDSISENIETWIKELYDEGLDSRQIQSELKKRFGFNIEISKLLRTLRKLSLPLPNPKRIKKVVSPWNKKINKREEKIIFKLHQKNLNNQQIANILEAKYEITVTKVTVRNTLKRFISSK